ncbi:hypothetical protein [Asticcacaulis sp. YBE204]|uniref:hypothetical protein n=1 Tax=Asticcacaulis sp. YBE204 TaxID=1282363 RepID=UPI0003C4095D|nr:hypothetical protein [Asticcacaulis sp. YBE204]ESQ80001.1 hypothetical protein AEYBE204_09130 [Asticcacaulis sp. YBE204]
MRRAALILFTVAMVTAPSARAELDPAGARRNYEQIETQYAGLMTWLSETATKALVYKEEGNMDYACAHWRGARDGMVEVQKALRDMIRYDKAAGGTGELDEQRLRRMQETHAKLEVRIRAECGG